jgi:N-acetylmuramic acid 6-phosphate (MurNAc-6-P) etherase
VLFADSPRRPTVYLAYIGVTCGFSAPYVAGQLNAIRLFLKGKHSVFPTSCRLHVTTACLLGFNPMSRARSTPIEGWNRSFADVCAKVFASDAPGANKFAVVNPIVGPETLTGSTRMKGGTATKFLLEVMLLRAFDEAGHLSAQPTRELLMAYRQACARVYNSATMDMDGWSDAIVSAGSSLVQEGRVMYFSDVPTFGILGFIDASECVPTFGADGHDVRGFVGTGWETLGNSMGDLSSRGELHQLSLDDGVAYLKASISRCPHNTVFVLSNGRPDDDRLAKRLHTVTSSCPQTSLFVLRVVASANVVDGTGLSTKAVTLTLPDTPLHPQLPLVLPELAIKLMINAITTGAHVAKGKVIKNVMADVGISNNKLFERACRIIAKFAIVALPEARAALLRAIWRVDGSLEEVEHRSVSEHIDQAATVGKIVPTAILLASGRCTSLEDAMEALSKEPVVRRLLM